ncbi:hypothetical protein [Hymenobacter daeguensis]
MKALLILGLALLLALAVRYFGPPAAGPGAAVAERLYAVKLLNAAGRDELLRRMRANELKMERTDPFTDSRQEIPATNRASILSFCADAFQTELGYRLPTPDLEASDLYIAGQALDPEKQTAAQHKLEQELKRFGGDTNAWLRHRYAQQPARTRIEEAIPTEDSLPKEGWTIYPPMSGLGVGPGLHHWISESRSVFGKTRTRTAHDLLAVGLLDKAAYQELQRIMRRGFLREAEVCQAAAAIMQRRQTYAQDLAQQQQWLLKLERAGQLTASQRQRIGAETLPYQVKSLFDVIGYCKQGRIVDLRQLPRQPQALYPALFRQVQALLPDFRYTGLRVLLREQPEGPDIIRQEATIRFQADGRTYENTFWQDFRRRDGTDAKDKTGVQLGEGFHASINRWLADHDSPRRLYLAHMPDARSVYGSERLGLLAMTASQRRLWGDNGYLLSRESHDNRFSSAGIEQLLATYQRLGLFTHLSAAEMAEGRRKALAGQHASCAEVLGCFPRMLYASDGESANPPYPYRALVKELAAMSRGGFAPTRVHDGFGLRYPTSPTVPFGFTLGGRAYQTQLPVNNDWMAPEATTLINRALSEQHAGGTFYDCLDGEGLIFLTPRQYTALHKTQPELFETSHDEDTLPAPAD